MRRKLAIPTIDGDAGMKFAHLHTHTEYSSLDGLGRVVDVVARAAALCQPAIAITDHGTLAGALAFDRACMMAGLKPIHGCEFFLALEGRFDRVSIEVPAEDIDADPDPDDTSGKSPKNRTKTKRFEHITVIATNSTGWNNLVLLNNLAQGAFWFKPLIDLELLAQHREGLIVFTGCLGGPIAGRIMRGDIDGARAKLRQMKEMFHGTDSPETSGLFVEVMSHGITAEDKTVLPTLAQLAAEVGLPTVATNDAHYVMESDRHAHDGFLCMQTNTKITSKKRFKFQGQGYHLRDGAEMRALFADHPTLSGACNNTLIIANRVETGLMPATRLRIPSYPVPADYTPSAFATNRGWSGSTAYLADLVREGMKKRYGLPVPEEVSRRAAHEFDTIANMGLVDYFLVTWDEVVNIARKLGIRTGPGRGSAAGCLISYVLGITQVDPIRNGLLFERFLSPERTSMPDIDIDFTPEGAQRVREALTERWGADRVAAVGTLGQFRSKAAVQAAGRVLNMADTADRMSKAIKNGSDGKPLPIADAEDELIATGSAIALFGVRDAEAIVKLAKAVEGVKSHPSVHPSAFLITPDPIGSEVPLRSDRRKGREGMWLTMWDGVELDALGFLKNDILSVIVLGIIESAIRNVSRRLGKDPSKLEALLDAHPDDVSGPVAERTWDLLAGGRTEGVFQLESSGMRRLCQSIAPSRMVDLAAIVALFRPGPLGAKMPERYAARKKGEEAVDYGMYVNGSPNAAAEAEAIASVLGETFGVFVFQEQAMRLGLVVAGFDGIWRNKLQKAISKKNAELMAEVGQAWMAGAVSAATLPDGTQKVVFAESTAQRVWDAIKSSADYAFNAAHSYGYGIVAWQTALLKANWPADYAAALLEHTKLDDKRAPLLSALRNEGVSVELPGVNSAGVHTGASADGTSVVFGLAEIKDISAKLAETIVTKRSEDGPYRSVADFVERIDDTPASCGPAQIIALAEAGAFDEFLADNRHRRGIVAAAPAIKHLVGWDGEVVIPDGLWDSFEVAQREIGRIQVLVSPHPISRCREILKAWKSPSSTGSQSCSPISLLPAEDGYVVPAGMIESWEMRPYAKGVMGKFTLAGTGASIGGVVWDEALTAMIETGTVPKVGQVYAVPGRLKTSSREVQNDDGETTIITSRDLMASAFWRIDIPSDAAPDTAVAATQEADA